MKDYNLWELIAVCCRSIWRGCRWLCDCLLEMLRLSLRRWYIVLPFVLLGTGVAAYQTRRSNLKYKVEARLHLNGPIASDIENAMLPLRYSNDGRIIPDQMVCNTLGIPFEDAVTTFAFATLSVIDCQRDSTADFVDYACRHDRTDSMSVVKQDEVCLQFVTRRPLKAGIVGQAVIDYLNGDEYLQSLYEAKKAVLLREQAFCKSQIEKLDSLTSVFYFSTPMSGNSGMHYSELSGELFATRSIEPLYNDMFELIGKTKKVERELAVYTAPVVTDRGFLVIPIVQNKRRVWYPVCMLAGYVAGCAAALLWIRRRRLREWLMREL